MNENQIHNLVKKYFSDIMEKEGLVYHKRMLILPTTEPLLRAIFFEPSGYDQERLVCTWFVQPLFVPCEYAFFNVGKRFSGWWVFTPTNEKVIANKIKNDITFIALPALKKLYNVRKVLNFLLKSKENPDERGDVTEYCAIWVGDKKTSKKYYNEFVDYIMYLEKRIGSVSPQLLKEKEEAKCLLDLSTKNSTETRKILIKHIKYTIRNLRLPEELWFEYTKKR